MVYSFNRQKRVFLSGKFRSLCQIYHITFSQYDNLGPKITVYLTLKLWQHLILNFCWMNQNDKIMHFKFAFVYVKDQINTFKFKFNDFKPMLLQKL